MSTLHEHENMERTNLLIHVTTIFSQLVPVLNLNSINKKVHSISDLTNQKNTSRPCITNYFNLSYI